MTELHELSALELGAAMRRREVSAVQVVEHLIDRADRLDAVVGAFITRTDALALEAARAADARVASARSDEELGALHGVPVPVKDLNMLEGVRFTAGSAAFADVVAPLDDHPVRRLKEAGAVITGKTSTPEFGLPCYTEPDVAPPSRTPWDLARSAGGSSGGAAAAVASGIAPVAIGSDGGGSIRIPSSVCGLVGIKPSRGRVSNGPLPDGLGELAVEGPLARSVEDAAALLDVLARAFVGDPWPLPPPTTGTFLEAARRDPGRLRIARYAEPVIADTVVDPRVLAVWEEASALLEEMGHVVVDVGKPFDLDAVPAFELVWSVGAASIPVPPDREHLLRPLTRWLRERGALATGPRLSTAVGTMRAMARQTIASTHDYDVVLTPTLAELPALVGGLRDDADPAADFEAQKRFTPFTSPYNISGQPAVSVPLGWPDVDGTVLPVGVQLVGRPGEDATVIALAAALERARPWAHRRPAL